MHDDSTPKVGLIYFVQGEVTKLVKIGFTTDLPKRLDAFRCHSAEEVRVLTTVAAEQRMEHALHLLFASARVRGEWFTMTAEMAAMIDALAGSLIGVPEANRRKKREWSVALETRLWQALKAPMSLKEIAATLDILPDTARTTMKRHPDRFVELTATVLPGRLGGRPASTWVRAGEEQDSIMETQNGFSS